ncbi:MAG TPA: plasmid stabilization protein [Geminicoccaceae bacterium]|nr:plasmid stabilization protein [Geminicoccus sp.]HMU49495.1 plasmid stabilization protein [Geminicoccaceae bacterium]
MTKTLLVRNVDTETARRLRLRAARHGRSMEAEHREILRAALADDSAESFWDLADKIRGLTEGTTQVPSEVLLRESRDER